MQILKKKTVVVAMSGGADSSAVAFLLARQGFSVIGLHMRLKDDYEIEESSIRETCRQLKIKFYPINLRAKFKRNIIKYFIDSYQKGLTPNPCVRCNQLIKFGELLTWRKKLGADYLATGHYARLKKRGDAYALYRSKDKSKDQTYFLYNLGQKELSKILFPLGEVYKKNIKKELDKQGISYLKKESQDICFLTKGGKITPHNEFLKKELSLQAGVIKLLATGESEENAKVIGEHQGLPLYTIGQRRGIEVGGIGPFYVAKMDYKKNILFVVDNKDHKLLLENKVFSIQNNWLSDSVPVFPLKCEAQIRYGHKAVDTVIKKGKGKELESTLGQKTRAITPGQSIVWYNKEQLLGGGIIK